MKKPPPAEKLLLWKCPARKTAAVSSGIRIFQVVMGLLMRANQRTPSAFTSTKKNSRPIATTQPQPCSVPPLAS